MAKFNVLVVDDANFIREFVRRGLTMTIPHVVVLEAVNGRHAQDILVSKPVDLVLCDWEMPEVDGHELLSWVRSDDRFRNLPFVMVTSRGEKSHVVTAVQAGIDGYVVKPFSIESLIAKMQEALARRGRSMAPEPPRSAAAAAASSEAVAILTGNYRKDAKEAKDPPEAVAILTGGHRKDAKESPAARETPDTRAPDTRPAARPETKRDPRGANETRPAPDPQRARYILSRVAAQLRFSGRAVRCLVQRLDLNGATLVVPQDEGCPTVMEPVVFALYLDSPAIQVKDLNAVVNAIEAIESRNESRFVRVTLRFVDEDPKKQDALARLITAV